MSAALQRSGGWRGARTPAGRQTAHAMQSATRSLAARAWRAPLAAALAALILVQAWALWRAPDAWYPASIRIHLAPGQNIALGSADLGAPRADTAHLQLGRDASGGWRLHNLSSARPVAVRRGDADLRLTGAPVSGAAAFQVGGALFPLAPGSPATMTFRHAGQDWRYDGATLYRNGNPQPPCAGTPVAARALALWNRVAPAFATWSAPLAIGGHVHCGNRLGVAGLAPATAMVTRHGGQLRLTAGPGDDGGAALLVHSPDGAHGQRPLAAMLAGGPLAWAHLPAGAHDARQPEAAPAGSAPALVLSSAGGPDAGLPQAATATGQSPTGALDARRLEVPLDGVTSLSVAGARYTVQSLSGGVLALAPSRHVAIYSAARVPETASPAVSWRWRQRTMWWQMDGWHSRAAMAALALAVLSGFSAAALPRRGPWRLPAHWLAIAAVLAAGVVAMAAQRAGAPLAPAASLLLATCGAALWLPFHGQPHRIPLAVGAALVLAMAGLLMQLELGLAAPDLSALRHYHKSAALLAVGSALAACWRQWRARAAQHPAPQRAAEWALAALTCIALAALAAQALWGDETGVFDMQPVELAKIVLAALTAHALALHVGGQADQHWRWLRLAAPALLFAALLAMALVSVDDYSPLTLLVVWAGGMALAYALAARRLLLAGALALAALAGAAAVGALHSGGADLLARLPQGFYADRFQVWLAPAAHPHTGQQWLQGARAIAAGGWLGADHALGLASAGMPDGTAAAIPAVQDDFAPAFFLYRHGLTGALLLWAVQAAMLAGLLQQAAACHGRAAGPQGFRAAWRERLHCFLLCGGAAFLLGHFLLSWGTNLAIFPVMGQPMSFMSAGGSHLLFFLCPLLAVSMDAGSPAPSS